ncbi:(2Fe-2S)-binding protein [Nocardioides jensenii]|uniref:(2Fe-2S)-binding protein n=1 Tax=Nocardioides jensenii TaxID=1843 RepID=UPI00082BA760|nr:(2Fe-2S)-binding protein [Nocardioides jensenii]
MIVCHCAAVNDDAVRRAYDDGARTVSQVCRSTGAGQDCGSCIFTVKRVVCQHGALAPTSPVEVEGAAS